MDTSIQTASASKGAAGRRQVVDHVSGTWELCSRIPHVTVYKKSRMLNRQRNELRQRLLRHERKRYSLIANALALAFSEWMVHQEAATGKDAAVQTQTSSSVNIEA